MTLIQRLEAIRDGMKQEAECLGESAYVRVKMGDERQAFDCAWGAFHHADQVLTMNAAISELRRFFEPPDHGE